MTDRYSVTALWLLHIPMQRRLYLHPLRELGASDRLILRLSPSRYTFAFRRLARGCRFSMFPEFTQFNESLINPR
jgi:hypothetical protein